MNEESKWLKVKEITIELGTYISRKTHIAAEEIEKMVEFSDYLVALVAAHQKIFDHHPACTAHAASNRTKPSTYQNAKNHVPDPTSMMTTP